jgi:excisionase family DNA binding protein
MSKLLTISQVAERLNIQTGTIYKWVAKRKITAIKLPGGDLRFNEDWLNNWLEQRTIKKKTA